MTRTDAERILRRWGWTPDRIAALPDGRAAFIAEDIPRSRVFIAAALGDQSVPRPVGDGTPSPQTLRALAEIRRAAVGDTRAIPPRRSAAVAAAAVAAAVATITRLGIPR